MAAERRWRAMGSDAHLIMVGGAGSLLDEAVRRVEDLEQRWSRFRPDSEVSELNRRAGEPVRVSAETLTLVGRAIEAWRLSGGAFDPTMLEALVDAGYDRSFDELDHPPRPPDVSPATASGRRAHIGVSAEDIRIDGDEVCLPAGIGFDPGGIGKGLAADLVAVELVAAGADGACVNLGGDVRVTGLGPEGGTWTVGIDFPRPAATVGAAIVEPLALLGLADGAVATSTVLRRRWTKDGEVRHHLLDPQTQQPSDTDLVFSSVVAGQAWIAEVLAKAVLLAGAAHPFDIIGGTEAQALAVDSEGAVQTTPGLVAFLGTAAVPTRVAVARIGVDSAGGPRRL